MVNKTNRSSHFRANTNKASSRRQPSSNMSEFHKINIDKQNKLQMICMNEFDKEIELKKAQLRRLNDTLTLSKELLKTLRKKCVIEYYQHSMKSFGDGYYKPLHPSMKNKCDDTEHMQNNVKSEHIHQLPSAHDAPKTETIVPEESNSSGVAAVVIPSYSKETKFTIVVGNTSKFFGNIQKDEKQQSSLCYKWIVYVQMRENMSILQSCIKKVRFILDPSYRPNDIVDVYKQPYQVSRCGWGEFIVRIRIYFHDSIQQKPLEMMHKLVLDNTLSGIHRMGAETVAEFWLSLKQQSLSTNASEHSTTINKTNTIEKTQQHHQSTVNSYINQTEDEYKQTMHETFYDNNSELADFDSPIIQSNEQVIIEPTEMINMATSSLLHDSKDDSTLKLNLAAQNHKSPQVSLLKSSYKIHNQSPSTKFEQKHMLIVPDHDYVCSYIQTEQQRPATPKTIKLQNIFCLDKYLNMNFVNVKDAVKYLLQYDMDTDTKYVTIISNAQNDWLRARQIQRLLRKHPHFRCDSEKELIWSVREIIQFARLHNYSDRCEHDLRQFSKARSRLKNINDIRMDNQSLCRHAISSHTTISDWLHTAKQSTMAHYETNNIVYVDNENLMSDNSRSDTAKEDSAAIDSIRNMIHLHSEYDLVAAIVNASRYCSMSPTAICTLASVLRAFLEKLLQNATHESHESKLLPYGICKAIIANNEFDFLTNCFMGTTNINNVKVKSETS